MSSDKFDFSVASQLIQAVEMTSAEIEIKNGQIEKSFMNLNNYFKDEGYNEFASDMNAANKSITEIIKNLHEIATRIGEYAQRLQEEE